MVGKPVLDVGHDLETAAVWEQQVQENDVRTGADDGGVPEFTGACDGDAVAVVLELDPIHLSNRRVILDQEHVNRSLPAGIIVAGEAGPPRELKARCSQTTIWKPPRNKGLDRGGRSGRAGKSSLSHPRRS